MYKIGREIMARYQQENYQQGSYLHGSEARQLQNNRKELRENEELLLRRKRIDDIVARKRLDKIYLVALVSGMVVLAALSISYLTSKSEASRLQKEYEKLQVDYNELKSSNDYLELDIESNIDYDRILDIAINDLGMVYAKNNQVYTYDKQDIEYVK